MAGSAPALPVAAALCVPCQLVLEAEREQGSPAIRYNTWSICLWRLGINVRVMTSTPASSMHMQAFVSPAKSSPSSKPDRERAAMLSKKGIDAFILKYKVSACGWQDRALRASIESTLQGCPVQFLLHSTILWQQVLPSGICPSAALLCCREFASLKEESTSELCELNTPCSLALE